MDLKLKGKMALAYLAYSLRLPRVPVGPLFVTIEAGNQCNLRCPMCPQSVRDSSFPEGRMSIERFEGLLHQIRPFTPIACLTLHLSAEPLLHPQIATMLRLSKEILGRRAGFATNASNLTPQRAREILDAGVGWVTIDFCADRETFERNRYPARWERTYRNVKGLLELIAGTGKDVTVQIKNVDWRDDGGQSMEELKALFRGLPVSRFESYRLHNWSADFARDASARLGFSFRSSGTYHPCSHLWFSLVVAYNGKVHLCCRDTEGDHVIADTALEDPVDIWNGEAFRQLRSLHARGRYADIAACKPCDRVWTGGYVGGNPLRVLARNLPRLFDR